MLSNTECNPKRIIQIVSGSRSGSSLLKYMLSKSPDVTSLDGEEEAYYKYSGNGYGLTSNSDRFNTMANPSLFRRCIHTELTTFSPWEWRLRLQYSGTELASLLERLPELNEGNPIPWLKECGIWGHYDGASKEERTPFKSITYEMTPYVIPTLKKTFTERPEVLLLKAPYSVYRKGLLESLFPETEFSYIILTRNPASTINGLIDGWNANYGFYKHLTPHGWWKFDLPPNWETYVNKTIPERCWLQWHSSYTYAQEFFSSITIKFEDVLNCPATTMKRLCNELDIKLPTINNLPLVMATETPAPYRWKKRADVILPFMERSQYLIKRYDYMDQSKWI